MIKFPMDGPDGLGWENEGSWEDLHRISCLWPTHGVNGDNPTIYDTWAKVVCMASEINMIEYFTFYHFQLSPETIRTCSQYAKKPTGVMGMIAEAEALAEETKAACEDGWYGHNGKCFKFSKKKVDQKKQLEYCKSIGGEMGTIDSELDVIMVNYAMTKARISG